MHAFQTGEDLRRRLAMAFHELSTQNYRRGLVLETSDRWSFSSVSHFSGAFFQQFGIRPTDAIGLRTPTFREQLNTTTLKKNYRVVTQLNAQQAHLKKFYSAFTD